MRDARRPTIDPTIACTMLYLQRDGITNCSTVADLNEWVTSDFDTLYDSRQTQNQNAKLDLKELVAQLQKSNTTSQSAGAGQYQ